MRRHRMHPTARILAVAVTLLCMLTFSPYARAQESSEPETPASERLPMRGRVLDESGKPLDGAFVRAFIRGIDSGQTTRTSARTNREGEFVIPNLDPGFYSVHVMSPPLIVVDGIPEAGSRPGQPMTIRMARGASITGKVLDRDGRPMTGLNVEPIRVRDAQGIRHEEGAIMARGGIVDDRGIYRLWGMEPGTYILAAGEKRALFGQPNYHSDRSRTFYASSNRSGATEVTVRTGDEIANADITFRGDAGYQVSGTVVSVPSRAVGQQMSIELYRHGAPSADRIVFARSAEKGTSFRLEGVEDGEYELAAKAYDMESIDVTERTSVRVRGADVNGVRLELKTTSTLSGRIEVKQRPPAESCDATQSGKPMPPARASDFAVRLRRTDAHAPGAASAQPAGNGEFTLKGLSGTLYRLSLDFGDETTYLESLDVATGTAAPARSSAIARDGVRVTRGQPVAGVRFVVSRGSARMQGRIVSAKEGVALPPRVRVCLVPSDRKLADDVIHYYEVEVERDGTFDLRNVRPGEYFVTTRVFGNDDRPDSLILPAAWDAKERAALRAVAEAGGIRVELGPCQRLESAVVRVSLSAAEPK